MTTNTQALMTIKEVAAWLAVSEDCVRRWIRDEGMPHFQVAERGVLRFKKEDVENWMRDGKRETGNGSMDQG